MKSADFTLLDAIGEPMVIIDRDWRYVHHNQQAAEYAGQPLAKLVGRSVWEAFPVLLGTPLERAYRKAMDERVRVELDSEGNDGRWFRVSAAPYAGGICVRYQDITERVRAESELRASESRYRELSEAEAETKAMLAAAEELARVGSWALDVKSGTLSWSDEMFRIYGVESSTDGMTFERSLERVHPDDIDRLRRSYGELVKTGAPVAVEYRVRRPDGAVATIQARARAQRNGAGETLRLLGSAQDISERVEADSALRRAHQLLATIIEDAPLAVVTIDADLRVTSWNPAAEHIFGWAASEVLGQPLPIVPEPRHAELVSMVDEEIASSFGAISYETQRSRRDGAVIDVHVATAPLHGTRGEITGAVAFMVDLSERNAARRALRDQEEQHRMVTDNMPVLIAYLDRDERYRFVNRAFERMFGKTRDAVLGRRIEEVAGPMAYQRIAEHMHAALGGQDVAFENEVCDATGMMRQVSVTYLPHRDESGAVVGVYALLADATERRQLEEQLRQSQKMEAVGRLAGGVAHDFNNLLTIVTVHCEMLLAQLPDTSPVRGDIQEIQQAGRRAAALTRQLLAFSRRQVFTLEVFGLNDLVTETQRMLRRLIGEDIHFELDLAADSFPVRADRAQLTQVLLNLVVNARDAMPHGGRLRIATANAHITAADSRRRGIAAGEYVELLVTDTGTGMDDATKARIFEPFFTTKEAGKGTGLGLSTVYGIVKQLEGLIAVDSTVGRGTTFTIYLPRATEAAPPRPVPSVDTSPRGSEIVLLVEDDDGVREIARRALEHQGYRVIQAPNGAEALQRSADNRGQIRLLLTDVIMPTISGPALAEELRRREPNLAVLFMSGYNDAAIETHGMLAPDSALIEKPFTMDALARKVREVLNAAPVPQPIASPSPNGKQS